jgi:cytidylate kinase
LARPSKIAIDGSAASGKSTLGARLAQHLGYLYFDTGVMYRAVTWAVLDRKIDPKNLETVSEVAEKLPIEVKPDGPEDGRLYTVLADGQDITWQIRSPEVEAYVSLISSYPRVRAALVARQRRIAAAGAIVMVGRDIGTVVLPDADLKIFMQASAEERARRREQEMLTQDKPANFEEILKSMRERDKQDQEKPISPMIPAPDAVIIETDNLSIEQVLMQLENLIIAGQTAGQIENER